MLTPEDQKQIEKIVWKALISYGNIVQRIERLEAQTEHLEPVEEQPEAK